MKVSKLARRLPDEAAGMKKAVYAGSFDPPTNGHLWMIEQGAKLFDTLVIAIGTNPNKECAFSVSERVEMLKNITEQYRNATIATFQNRFLVNYAESVKAGYILRGIRSEGDYEYERVMRHVNADLNRNILTVFLMPPREIAEVSSGFVKGLVGPNGWEKIVRKYIPLSVHEKLLEKFESKPHLFCIGKNMEEYSSAPSPF
jgi:pantetheine-phosphate adenylyltransferase